MAIKVVQFRNGEFGIRESRRDIFFIGKEYRYFNYIKRYWSNWIRSESTEVDGWCKAPNQNTLFTAYEKYQQEVFDRDAPKDRGTALPGQTLISKILQSMRDSVNGFRILLFMKDA